MTRVKCYDCVNYCSSVVRSGFHGVFDEETVFPLLLYVDVHDKSDGLLLRIVCMHEYCFTHQAGIRIRFERYFNLSAAAGRGLLVRKEGSGTASTGLNFINFENGSTDVFEGEYML